jgi:type II secretory pathway pseudopilin PulG
MIRSALSSRARRRSGITLTEILIAILILAVGLASLATLFPLGLLRLRDAANYSRSAYLAQSAAADLSSRSLLLSNSFGISTPWYTGTSLFYNPFIQDTPSYGADWAIDGAGPGAYAGSGGSGIPNSLTVQSANGNPTLPATSGGGQLYPTINGAGLPFAYDPLWRYQTINPGATQANGPAASGFAAGGYYPFDVEASTPSGIAWEARFGSGLHFIRSPDADGGVPSAHGLQRITNFNRPSLMPASVFVPSIFVSGEDVVWQEPTNQNYQIAGNAISGNNTPAVGAAPSPVIPDLNITTAPTPQQVNDFHYSWMFTGQLTNSSNEACFDGNIVIFNNRPFGISTVTAPDGTTWYQVDGETVVEAIFGHGGNIQTAAGFSSGYATGADRTVLLRWNATLPDPVVKAGDWIADVTYERSQSIVISRWWPAQPGGTAIDQPSGIPNPTNNLEWDNLPAQRCYWYQIQKASPAVSDPYVAGQRSMVVYVNQSLQARTSLTAAGVPAHTNAALIAPSVVNVIPQTIFVR